MDAVEGCSGGMGPSSATDVDLSSELLKCCLNPTGITATTFSGPLDKSGYAKDPGA